MLSVQTLNPNDQVALIAPAGFIPDESAVIAAESWLASVGLKSVRGSYVLGKKGVFSGTDKKRLEDFQMALNNPAIKAIWALRGGYGAMRIMERLNFTKFKQNPKWLIGFSDITAFHNLWHQMGYESIHGIMPIQISKNSIETQEGLDSLRKVLFGERLNYQISSSKYNKNGEAEGILVGGNLSLLQSLSGTPYQLQTDGKILFIEEVGEYKYRLDRLLQSLKLAGVFENLKGLIVGGFTDIKDNGTPFGKEYEQMVIEVTKGKKYPILFDFPAGHFPDNRALILGRMTQLSVTSECSKLSFNF